MNLGEIIYRLRTKQSMSQDTLAEALGVSRQSVSKWENNAAVPELEKLIKMSELFGVTLDELVGRDAPTPTPPAEVPVQTSSARRTIGIILLCFGLLTTLILSLLGGFIIGVIFGLPFTLVGCILISDSTHPFFHSAWAIFAGFAPVVIFCGLNMIGFGVIPILTAVAIWLAGMIIWSVVLLRKEKGAAGSRKFIIVSLIIALVLSVLLTVGTSVYYRHRSQHTATEAFDVSSMQIE